MTKFTISFAALSLLSNMSVFAKDPDPADANWPQKNVNCPEVETTRSFFSRTGGWSVSPEATGNAAKQTQAQKPKNDVLKCKATIKNVEVEVTLRDKDPMWINCRKATSEVFVCDDHTSDKQRAEAEKARKLKEQREREAAAIKRRVNEPPRENEDKPSNAGAAHMD